MHPRAQLEETAAEVVTWRRDRLLQAGFGRLLATRLAHDPLYDLHGLIDLVEHGCPPELAVQILAPLVEESAA